MDRDNQGWEVLENSLLPNDIEKLEEQDSLIEDQSQLDLMAASLPQVKDPKTYLEAPFSYNMTSNESVSLANGALQYTVTDFVLPGRNGFDLNITRQYNSANSNMFDMSPTYNANYQIVTGFRYNNHEMATWGLGVGWRFHVTVYRERDACVALCVGKHVSAPG